MKKLLLLTILPYSVFAVIFELRNDTSNTVKAAITLSGSCGGDRLENISSLKAQDTTLVTENRICDEYTLVIKGVPGSSKDSSPVTFKNPSKNENMKFKAVIARSGDKTKPYRITKK